MNNDSQARKSGNLAPLAAGQALDAFFLEARGRLLDVAAILDRINRGLPTEAIANDPRLEKIRQALEVLHDVSGGRAERIQQIFSQEYDANWERPQPRFTHETTIS